MPFVLSGSLLLLFASGVSSQEKSQVDSVSVHSMKSGQDPWFGIDKAKHFGASALMTGVSFFFLHEAADLRKRNAAYGSGIFVFGIGLGKEAHDGKRQKGRFSFKDLVADLAGIGFALLLIQTP